MQSRICSKLSNQRMIDRGSRSQSNIQDQLKHLLDRFAEVDVWLEKSVLCGDQWDHPVLLRVLNLVAWELQVYRFWQVFVRIQCEFSINSVCGSKWEEIAQDSCDKKSVGGGWKMFEKNNYRMKLRTNAVGLWSPPGVTFRNWEFEIELLRFWERTLAKSRAWISGRNDLFECSEKLSQNRICAWCLDEF